MPNLKHIAIAMWVTLLFMGCVEKGNKPNSSPIQSGDTLPEPIIPVAEIAADGQWGELISQKEILIHCFQQDYFPGSGEYLTVKPGSLIILEDSMNSKRTMIPYLVAKGYDSKDEKEVFLRLQLSKKDGLFFLYSIKQNVLEIFQCEDKSPSCRLNFLPNGQLDGCLDSTSNQFCIISQYVLGHD